MQFLLKELIFNLKLFTFLSNSSSNTGDNLKSNTDIDEHYGRRKVEFEFRDLLNAYKQTTNNNFKDLYMPFKSTIYSTTNESKEGQIDNNNNNNQQQQHQHQPHSSEFGFPKAAIVFKESPIKDYSTSGSGGQSTTNYYHQTNIKPTLSSKYQSQSSNNRVVKQQLSSNSKLYSSRLSLTPQYELNKLKDDYSLTSEFDLPIQTEQLRKLGGAKILTSNFDNNDELEYEMNDNNNVPINVYTGKTKKTTTSGSKNLNDYYFENPTRSSYNNHHQQNKSMNRNLKLYNSNSNSNSNNKKSDYLDNYHETDDDQDFFSKDFQTPKSTSTKSIVRKKDKLTGRQLSRDRDFRADEYEDDFFNEQQPNEKSVRNNQKTKVIKTFYSTGSNSRSSYNKPINFKTNNNLIDNSKLSKKLIAKSSIKDEIEEDDSPIDSNNSNLENTNYITNQYDTHHQLNNNNNYLNKNQLNLRANVPPRSVLVKTSSYSFEIPNHSEHEEVEFDDHISKQHKIRPSYTLDQNSRKTLSTATIAGGDGSNSLIYKDLYKDRREERHSYHQPLQTTPTLPSEYQYDLKTPTNTMSRSNHDHLMPYKKTEKQQYSTSIEHNNNILKSNLDDDLFNQFEIKRQPPNSISNRNHHLPHSHIEDVEAFYKASIKKPNKGKFKQFFHQQELKHHHNNNAANSRQKVRDVNLNPNSNSNLDSADKFETDKPSIKDDLKNTNYQSKENKLINSSPISKPPRIYFNWHSSINHNAKNKQHLATIRSKPKEIDLNTNLNVNENDAFDSDKNENLNKLNAKSSNNQNNNMKSTRTPLDDEWFKQDWFKTPELNSPPSTIYNQPPPPQHNQQNPKVIKNDVINSDNNNDIDSGEIEYEDELNNAPIPVLENNNNNNHQLNNHQQPVSINNEQPLNNNQDKSKLNLPIRLKAMNQQNKQYTSTTTLSPSSNQQSNAQTNQASSKNSITPTYKTKYLSSSEFAKNQKLSKNIPKYKSSFKPTSQPSTSTTATSTELLNLAKETSKKSLDYQKAKQINLQYKKDKKNTDSTTKPQLPFTRTTMKQQHDKQNLDKMYEKSSQNMDSNQKDKSESSKKVIVNSNLQNSSSTINAQILDKLPISVDSIFDNIDDDNFDYESDPKSTLQNKKGDLPIESFNNNKNDNSKDSLNDEMSNENSINDLTTTASNRTASGEHQFGTRITGNNGKLQPKVSIKASYSSVSSTEPRAMAQKMNTPSSQRMDTQKVDSIGFRSLDQPDDLILNNKNENNLFKNRMKQFKHHSSWLSPLTNLNNLKNLDKNLDKDKNSITTTSSPIAKNKLNTTKQITNATGAAAAANQERKNSLWKGFSSKQQKIIDQKKSLDDKSFKKSISPYLSKFRKEKDVVDKQDVDKKESFSNASIVTSTLKSTSTTVPTTTLKSTVLDRKFNHDKFRSLNRFKNYNELNNHLNSSSSVLINLDSSNNNTLNSLNKSNYSITSSLASTSTSSLSNNLKTNYNLNFSNNVNSSVNNSISNPINNQNNNSTKPYKRIFSALSAGVIQSRSSSRN